eukprot:GGOE01025405.1.p1 GENE.GGOE01025405.1~~GGOE01025405.1.p1  ORF type:complete len:475 (+),score=162.96 GGOE01025405.1:62-1426(+)
MACRVPLLLVLTSAMLVVALVPAILIWIIVFLAMNESMDILTSAGRTSITTMAQSMQDMVIGQSMQSMASRLEEVVQAVETQLSFLQLQGLSQLYLGPLDSSQTAVETAMCNSLFAMMRAHPLFSLTAVRALECPSGLQINCTRTLWYGQQALFYDFITKQAQRTLWSSNWRLSSDRTVQTNRAFYRNQTTGAFVRSIVNMTQSPLYYSIRTAPQWLSDYSFSPFSYQPELYYYPKPIAAVNNTWIDVFITLNIYTISDDLRAEVAADPEARLFLFFRQSHGHLLGASHGKFFSMSDVDLRGLDLLTHPPNASLLRPYTCLESTDILIAEACRELYAMAGSSWLGVEAWAYDTQLNGTAYWVSVGLGNSSGFQYVVVSLKCRASVLGQVDDKVEEANLRVEGKRVWSYIVLGVATGVAVVCPVFILCLLRRRLMALGDGYVGKAEKSLFPMAAL